MKINQEQTQYFGRDLDVMSLADNYYSWVLSEFQPYIGKHVVEVGAGIGTVSEMFLDMNPESFVAVEPSDNMYPLLEQRFKDRLKVRTIKGFFDQISNTLDQHPDTLLYINVMEHVEHDAAEIKHAYEVLAPGGHLCIFVPALQWIYGSFDASVGHYRRYYKKDLVKMVEAAGFEVKKARYFDALGFIPWFILFRVLRVPALSSGHVSLYDKIVVPFLRVFERIVPPPLGKNLLLVAQKPQAV